MDVIAERARRQSVPGVFWIAAAIALSAVAGFVSGIQINSFALFIFAAGGLAVIVSLARLEWALLAVVVITYTNLSEIATSFHGAPPVAKLYVPLVWAALLARWFLKGEKPGGSASAFGVIGAYVLVSAFSASYALNPNLSLTSAIALAKDALIGFTALAILTRAETLRKVVWTLLASGAFLSAATVYQFLSGTYPVAVGGFARASIELIAVGTDNTWRHAGPLDDPNHYGQILVALVPLAFERIMNDKRRLLRLGAIGILLLLLVAILLSYSRGAILAIALIGVTYLVIFPARLKVLIPLFITGVIIVQFAPPSYLARMSTFSALAPSTGVGGIQTEKEVDIAVEGRLGEMQVALEMFLDNSFLGVGYANYEQHYQKYELQLNLRPRGQARAAHSLFLEIAAEQGLVGLISFGALMVLLLLSIVRSARMFKRLGQKDYEQMAIAVGLALMAYAITAVFLHNSYARYMWLLVGIGLALPQMATHQLRLRAVPPEEKITGSRRTV